MFLVGILSWWYSDGWKGRVEKSIISLRSSADFFSIGRTFATLFDPFRQISANQVDGTINIKIQSFFDRLLSRIIGFVMRIFLIISGFVVMFAQTIFALIVISLWFVVPFMPFVGLILSILRLTV